MFVQELETSHTIDGVRAIEKLDGGSVADSQSVVEPPHLGVLVSNPLIGSHSIAMAAFDHEWPRRYKARHFGVVEGLAKIKFGHFILTGERVTKRRIDRDVFAD